MNREQIFIRNIALLAITFVVALTLGYIISEVKKTPISECKFKVGDILYDKLTGAKTIISDDFSCPEYYKVRTVGVSNAYYMRQGELMKENENK